MPSTKKIILDQFQAHLLSNYKSYCLKHGIPLEPAAFVTYLIDQNLIAPNTIKRYTILREFQGLYKHNERKKTRIVNTLSEKYHISERSIWNMLRKETMNNSKTS